ncbi:carboxylesterase family protein [Amycolatopsis acidicola]|uniref:Carboxylic ester hydrolase n=1 Tax=Amycolatopsis acidicola TaxID=2596893 RepID=A0A5N0UYN3_9PSEU|nr:carboxylesterase/lipase family protein [Amycolatopsis acidicola]KAA9154934.1 carboxylesterase family protein [Amycolatopsis acidicola]
MGKRRLAAALSALLLVTACGAGAAASQTEDVVRTSDGLVRGIVAGGHRSFSGIPYAAPPVGQLRWRAPQPVQPWEGVLDASHPAAACAQPGKPTSSEDCLYLNVTAPEHPAANLPVMVWVPGGGFIEGAGSDYDPSAMATQGNVIVVTLNYRLGALGFLLAGDDPAAGNFGLADQQAALRWVRDNIAAFGGDAGNVTLFGQSAGAYSVCGQLTSPAAKGLFGKAIIQSGPCGNSFMTVDDARARAEKVEAELGCADVACLRAKPVSAFTGLDDAEVYSPTGRLQDMAWGPVAQTAVVPRQPLEALENGAAKGIPLIQGTTRDELRSFVALGYPEPVTADGYVAAVRRVFGDRADAVLAEYPVDRYPSPGIALSTVLGDWGEKLGACTALPADDAAARSTPVYAYEFAQDDGKSLAGLPLGATHSAELPYLFGSGGQLGQTMIRYWTDFAKTGNPGWPAYRQGGPVLSISAGKIAETDFAGGHHCGFWR